MSKGEITPEGQAIGKRVAEMREQRGLTPAQLAAYSGVSKSWLSRLEGGYFRRPGGPQLGKIARIMHVDVDDILRAEHTHGERALSYNQLRQLAEHEAPFEVPVYDQIAHARAGGVPMEYVYVPAREARGKRLAAVPVRGDCMAPTINDGDLIVIDLEGVPVPGDVVATLLEGDDVVIARYVEKTNSHVRLRCDNPSYSEREVEEVRIVGVIVQAIRDRQALRRPQ